jgi:hypothetical protein
LGAVSSDEPLLGSGVSLERVSCAVSGKITKCRSWNGIHEGTAEGTVIEYFYARKRRRKNSIWVRECSNMPFCINTTCDTTDPDRVNNRAQQPEQQGKHG